VGDESGGDNLQSQEGETMRKVTRTLAIALLLAGSVALTADAQTSRGAGNISSAAQNFTPIEQVACRGWGPYCRPGFTRVCGPYRCWCRRCW
jgi:predicted small secreted protein